MSWVVDGRQTWAMHLSYSLIEFQTSVPQFISNIELEMVNIK